MTAIVLYGNCSYLTVRLTSMCVCVRTCTCFGQSLQNNYTKLIEVCRDLNTMRHFKWLSDERIAPNCVHPTPICLFHTLPLPPLQGECRAHNRGARSKFNFLNFWQRTRKVAPIGYLAVPAAITLNLTLKQPKLFYSFARAVAEVKQHYFRLWDKI